MRLLQLRSRLWLTAVLLPALVVAFLTMTGVPWQAAFADTTVTVKPSNMQGWAFFDDNGNGGFTGFVSGPSTPPLGSGSADFILTASNQGVALGTAAYQGTRMDALTTLSYSTYRTSGGTALAPALLFDIDYDVTDLNTAYQGRLVFEPYYTNSVSTGAWQTWDTLTGVGAGNWWASNAIGQAYCPIGNPCTWSEVLSHFPNAGVRTPGALLFKAGSGWASFNGNIDNLLVGTISGTTTFDFEAEPCSSTCYVNGTTGNDGFDGASVSSAKKTIQAGVNAVSPGGTVNVAAATYNEQVSISTNGVTLNGAGMTSSIIRPASVSATTTSLSSGNPIAPIVLVGGVTGVTVKGFKVDGTSAAFNACSPGYMGIYYRNASGTIQDSRVTGIFHPSAPGCQAVVGVFVQSGGAGSADVDVKDSTIDSYGKNGITCNEAATTCDITGNTVIGRGPVGAGDAAQNGIQVAFGAGGSIDGNQSSGHDYTPATASATGILVFEPADGLQIDNNNIHNNMEGILIETANDIGASGNTVANNGDVGIFAFDADNGTYDNNSISGNSTGLWLADASGNSVLGSTINANGHGIIIDGDSVGASITGNNITNNTASSSGVHIDSFGGFSPSNVQVHFNNIVGNGGSGGYGVFNGTLNLVNAENNWWGACDGPSGAGPGSGDSVSTVVDFDPWSQGSCDPDGDLLSNDQETLIYGTDPNNPDTDGDGCQDGRELLPSYLGAQGGGRNPLDYWDFFDTPNPANQRDKLIDLFNDILGVANRFGANDAGGTALINRNTSPLSAPPVSPSAYHPAFDRGVQTGADFWDLAPADGEIDLFNDIFGVAKQFGFDCN